MVKEAKDAVIPIQDKEIELMTTPECNYLPPEDRRQPELPRPSDLAALEALNMPTVMATTKDKPVLTTKAIVKGAEEERADKEALTKNLTAIALVLSYLVVGFLYYHFVEDWDVVDTVYYSIVIVTTVGYGDITPHTKAGKAFTIFYAFYGIVTIGMALGRLANWFVDRQKSIAKQATKKVLDNVNEAASSSKTDSANDLAMKKLMNVANQRRRTQSRIKRTGPILARILSFMANEHNRAVVFATIPIWIAIGGGLIIGAVEGWPVLDCFYYSIITITTIGFGDLSPKSLAGRLVAIVVLPCSVISVAHAIGSILEELNKRSVMKTKISMKELIAMDANGDGEVSKLEYLSYMLIKLGKAEQEDIDGILAQFDKLDKDRSGVLDKNDLERLDRVLQAAERAEKED